MKQLQGYSMLKKCKQTLFWAKVGKWCLFCLLFNLFSIFKFISKSGKIDQAKFPCYWSKIVYDLEYWKCKKGKFDFFGLEEVLSFSS